MEEAISEPPVDYGRRLVPHIVDEIAHSQPEKPFISIPISADIKDGCKDISYNIFAKAVNRCAWWMEKELGRNESETDLNTVFYIGPLDIRYLIVLLAAAKTGNIVGTIHIRTFGHEILII